MATATKTDPSTRRLSEVARHVVVPAGIVDTLWFKVERQCAEWGDQFDTWQDGLGQITLGLREDGTFAATVGGVTWSIPRQVAKTFLVSRIIFALCILYPNLTVLWTAHRTRTATQTFNKLKGLAQKPGIKPYMAPGGGIRSVNGEQEFAFANGSKIMFGAREQGFGRGFDEVDIEVFDEAQILTEKALEDMVAATNQSRFPHGALLFFMGTPPRPGDPGEEFSNRRTEALALKPAGTVYAEGEDSLYVECSADPKVGMEDGPAIDDPKQVEIANPSVPHRTPWISIKRLRKQLTSDGSWRREGLGVWDEKATAHDLVVDLAAWDANALPLEEVPDGDPGYYALAMSPERIAFIAVAVPMGDGCYLDLAEGGRMDDSRKVVEWFAQRKADGKRVTVAIDSRDPAASMVNELRAKKIRVNVLGASDSARGAGDFVDAAEGGRISHFGQPLVRAGLEVARKKPVGKAGLWEWDPEDLEPGVAALRAITNARFGLTLKSRRSDGAKKSKVVVVG